MKTLSKLFVCIAIALATTSCVFFAEDPFYSKYYNTYSSYYRYSPYYNCPYYGYRSCMTIEYIDYYWPAQRANGEYISGQYRTVAIGKCMGSYVALDISGSTGYYVGCMIYF